MKKSFSKNKYYYQDPYQIIYKELTYTIKIGDINTSFEDVLKEMDYKLEREFPYYNEGIKIQNKPLIVKYIGQRITELDNENSTKTYIINYEEKRGSFVGTVTFLIITTAIGYGGARQSIDYVIQDLAKILDRAFDGKYSIRTFIESEKDANVPQEANNTPGGMNIPLIISITSIIISLFFAFFLTFYHPASDVIKTDNIEEIIEEKIDKKLEDKKIDLLFDHLLFEDPKLKQLPSQTNDANN